jgi:hypothetical protein
MTRFALVLAVAGSLLIAGAESKPNFSGRWELDTQASDPGPEGSKPNVTEIIKHDDPVFQIDRTIKGTVGEFRTVAKLRTDGTEVENLMGDHTVKSRTSWEGSKLKTVVQMEGGDPMTEVREIDSQGRMISYMGYKADGKSGTIRLVFKKK